MTDKLILDVAEVAALLGVPVSTVYRGFGPPPLKEYGRRKRWRRADVLAWIENLKTEEACPSTDEKDLPSGGAASKSTERGSGNRRKKQTEATLFGKSSSSSSRRGAKPRHLAAVPGAAD